MGQRRVVVPVSRAVRLSCASALLFVADPGKEGSGGIPRSAPFDASASTPRGASGLVGAPTPDDDLSYSITLFPLLTQPGSQGVCGAAARTRGRARGACGEGGTTGAADLLSAGHSPHPLAWPQALPPNHARPQAGLDLWLVPLRLVYRPEPVRKPQPWG
jgi:hypothetical protein